MKTAEGFLVGCPDCRADALYRYGRIWTGKQRYICLLCGRQFTPGSTRKDKKLNS
ncbi:MAG: IS1 family transposase [Deltaproteobacteria bacterium]|nr:IS1 family transposase [Deltaproteobacteria bacterium]